MKKYNKTSDIVSGQLPNFVAEEYPQFVAFIEAYYRYLETQKINRNVESMRDVDSTLTDFVSILKAELSHAAPNYKNNKFYLPHLKQHFVSRGSQESYDLLFRLLYNKDIELKYPKDSILKVSDGKWYQDHSIFVKLTSGDIGTLKHKYVLIKTADKSIRIHVDKVLTLDESLGIYEIYFSRNYYGEITVGSTLSYNGVQANLLATTSKIKIFKGGQGFRLGQVFSIPSAVGSISEAAIKVSKIGSGGEIKEIQKIDFGVGYANSFYYTISNKEVEAELYSFPLTSHIRALEGGGTEIIYQNPAPGYKDPTGGFVDTGYVNRNNYFEYNKNIAQADPLYGSGNYVGEIETQFQSNTANKIIDDDSAILIIELGAVAVYPGYYSSTDSFVSGISYIQDGEYYQDFSYIIKVDEKLDTYRDAVLQFLHPTGRKLFGEYSIESNFILEIQTVLSVLRLRLADLYGTSENVDFFIGKSLIDNTSPVIDSINELFVTKPLSTTLDPQTDSTTYYLDKLLFTTLDPQTDSNTYYLIKPLESILPQQTDSNTYVFGKSLASILAQQTESTTYYLDKPLSTTLSPQTDSNTYYLDKPLSSTLSPQTDSINELFVTKPLSTTLSQQTESVGLFTTKAPFASILSQQTESVGLFTTKGQFESILPQQTDSNVYSFGKALESILPQQSDSINELFVTKPLSTTLSQQTESVGLLITKGQFESILPQQTESVGLLITKGQFESILPQQTESVGLVTTKGQFESILNQPTDSYSYIFDAVRTFEHTVASVESVGLVTTKGQFESILSQPTDSYSYIFDAIRSFNDSTAPSDLFEYVFTAGRLIELTIGVSDSFSFIPTKNILDLPSATDSFTYVFTAIRSFDETINSSESFSLIPTKNISDLPSATDSFSYVFNAIRSFNDSTVSSDSFSLGTIKNFPESITATSVSTVIVLQKSFQESTINTDTGTLQLNPYYSTDYFSQDYQVGRTSF